MGSSVIMRKRCGATILIACLCFLLFTGCGQKIRCNPPQGNYSGNIYHPHRGDDPYITDYFYTTVRKGGKDYWDPVAGANIVLHFATNEYLSEIPELTLYVFEYNDGFEWNTDDAYLSVQGDVSDDIDDRMTFEGKLPSEMDTGDYAFVIVDEQMRIDTVMVFMVLSSEDAENAVVVETVAKPVIYLYPEEDTECNVVLHLDGNLTCTYPVYDDDFGWNVTAHPDGHITNHADGRDYDYLFWEGQGAIPICFENAVCVRGCDTASFLEDYLEAAGLTYSEIDDFISYWLPRMEGNSYNLISFPAEAYEQMCDLDVSPTPDSVIRVYMVFTPLDEEMIIEEEDRLIYPEPIEREGFTVVEWGGTEI